MSGVFQGAEIGAEMVQIFGNRWINGRSNLKT
jgi:hypothetical protein